MGTGGFQEMLGDTRGNCRIPGDTG